MAPSLCDSSSSTIVGQKHDKLRTHIIWHLHSMLVPRSTASQTSKRSALSTLSGTRSSSSLCFRIKSAIQSHARLRDATGVFIRRWSTDPLLSASENVIGQAVRLYWARADRDFTVPVGLGPEDQDLTSVPGPVRSEAFKMSVGPV